MGIFTFTQRTSAPSTTDLRWIKTTYGGYNKCILGSPSYATGSVLANCTGYVHGRWMELLNRTSMNLYTGNASGYYGYTSDGYTRGSTPHLGDIICFSGGSDGAGHVAVVEYISNDGSYIITSNSAYGGSTFYRQTLYRSNSWTWSSSYSCQGFIYLPMALDETDAAIIGNRKKKKVKVMIR